MPKNEPTKQHFIPQSILRLYSRDNSIPKDTKVYIKRANKAVTHQKVSALGYQNNLYTFTNKNNQPDYAFEKNVDKVFTDPAILVINKLENSENISDDEKLTLTMCIAMLQARRPKFKKLIEASILHTVSALSAKNLSKESYLNELDTDILERLPSEGEKVWLKETLSNAQIIPNNAVFLESITSIAVQIFSELATATWTILHVPASTSFIRSEAPILYVSHNVGRIGEPFWHLPCARQLVPLSKNITLEITPGFIQGLTHTYTTKYYVREINRAFASTAVEFIIGQDEALIANLARDCTFNQQTGVTAAGYVAKPSNTEELCKAVTDQVMANLSAKNLI